MSQAPFITWLDLDHSNSDLFQNLEKSDFRFLLTSSLGVKILGIGPGDSNGSVVISQGKDWTVDVAERIQHICSDVSDPARVFEKGALLVGLAALHAFLQSNVTGPPLEWQPEDIFPPLGEVDQTEAKGELRDGVLRGLVSDGETVYQLAPYIELFATAKAILNHPLLSSLGPCVSWARLRVNTWHQRMLSGISSILQDQIYADVEALNAFILAPVSAVTNDIKSQYLIERSSVDILHGRETSALNGLDEAKTVSNFEYILTGRLGRRTKFQQFDLSQLVVLAKSYKAVPNSEDTANHLKQPICSDDEEKVPKNLPMNDDTLFETINFSKPIRQQSEKEDEVPPELRDLDPSKQPPLRPLDAIILLSVASAITNNSPDHGLTREETLPYALRVLESGSTNWQVYTQALLTRSRIESHKSRTVERSVLQLQALVDQVIVETTGVGTTYGETGDLLEEDKPRSFLPTGQETESASATQRLLYIHQLASPPRWILEAELASRWVSLGALRTALEIYERLEMWAEAALCWAATDREDKAASILESQLYEPMQEAAGASLASPRERSPLPTNAPRLLCLLGDIRKSPSLYERAWEVSRERYAPAQRSLAKHYMSTRNLPAAEEAFSKSLSLNPINFGAWFSLGCIRLEGKDWAGAVRSFTRAVQIEQEDAEAWSNLAAALLRLPVNEQFEAEDDLDGEVSVSKADPERRSKEALVAFKRAATLKRDSYQIWRNILNVGASITPPPYKDIMVAQQRIIELRSKAEGERCVDAEIMEGLLAHVIATSPQTRLSPLADNREPSTVERSSGRFGLEGMFVDLVYKHVVPLITHSRRLWKLVAKLSMHLDRPGSALDAFEKAWRTALNRPGWEDGSDTVDENGGGKVWDAVVDATVELADAYESLGEREATEGLKAGSGELVCKNWRYKSRMALRSVVGRRKKAGLEDCERLEERIEDLKG